MHLPADFVESDLTALDRLIAADNFITLVTVVDGAPTVNHLPALYRRDVDAIELRGHWARSNTQARHEGPALAIVHGPNAYVSPAWYPDKEAQARVPTWNYAVAHLSGRLETFDDEASLAELVGQLSSQHEAAVGSDWKFEPEREEYRSQLRGIVGFRFFVDRASLKFKFNQNHPTANRVAVADRLDAIGSERGRAVAALMRERLD
jgi:transcriptional regulator